MFIPGDLRFFVLYPWWEHSRRHFPSTKPNFAVLKKPFDFLTWYTNADTCFHQTKTFKPRDVDVKWRNRGAATLINNPRMNRPKGL